jgi:hypothetical protein
MADPILEEEIRCLEKTLSAARAAERQAWFVGRIGTAILLLLLLGFLTLIVLAAREQYRWSKFDPHVRREVDRIVPLFGDRLRIVADEIRPEYVRMARATLDETLPVLRDNGEREWRGFVDAVSRRADNRIQEAVDRLEILLWERMRKHFPELTDPEQRARFVARWRDKIESDLMEILDHLHHRYQHQLAVLQADIDAFRPNRFEPFTQEQLARHWVHLWLMLLDRYIVELNEAEGAKLVGGNVDGR